MASNPLVMATSAAFAAILLVAAIGDFRTRRIPNSLVLGLAFGAAAHYAAAGPGAKSVALSLLTAFGVLAGGALLFRAGSIGAGDAKLAAAVALWLDPRGTGLFLLHTSLLGAVSAILYLAFSRRSGAAGGEPGSSCEVNSRKIPYAPAISAGALMTFATTRFPWL